VSRCATIIFLLFGLVKLITSGQEWNGSFFEHLYLRDLGLRIQLNHPPGSICQWRTASHKNFVVLHTNGIHSVNIDFCGCSPAVSCKRQLLRTSWWPATPLEPQTCATFTLLNQFHLLSLQGKTSAFDFYRSLEYITENHGLEKLPVSSISASFGVILTGYQLIGSFARLHTDGA
jgi:CxC2 like cysteine cluster associated with KDZ transposases